MFLSTTVLINLGLGLLLDPDLIVTDFKEYDIDSHGIVYLSIDPSFGELSFEVFFEGITY